MVVRIERARGAVSPTTNILNPVGIITSRSKPHEGGDDHDIPSPPDNVDTV